MGLAGNGLPLPPNWAGGSGRSEGSKPTIVRQSRARVPSIPTLHQCHFCSQFELEGDRKCPKH
jgi:hypothetical protein